MHMYIEPVLSAAFAFPFAAALFTFPYMLLQYRRYGSVLPLRTLIVYSFILYLMSAYFLTMLPLPSMAYVEGLTTPYLQLEPFKDVWVWVQNADVVWSQPSTWRQLINRDLFVMLANIGMTIPLGIYLRYYFRCSFRKTVLIALAVSLVFELTQLSALFGIYPRPYRLCETDDLITNTLGGIIGFWITKPLLRILPSRERIDQLAYRHSTRVTFTRRFTAALFDWFLLGIVMLAVAVINPFGLEASSSELQAALAQFGGLYFILVTLYFIVGTWLQKGLTVGKRITHIRLSDQRSGGSPRLWQVAVRYAFLYFGFLYLPFATVQLLYVALTRDTVAWPLLVLCGLMILVYGVLCVWGLVALINRKRHFPHSMLSKTCNVSTLVLPNEADAGEKALPADKP